MILAEKGGVKIMSIENGLVSYSMEDLMEIVQAADDGLSIRFIPEGKELPHTLNS